MQFRVITSYLRLEGGSKSDVVYFDQPTGVFQTVHAPKTYFWYFNNFFPHKREKEEKLGPEKSQEIFQKYLNREPK